MHKTSTLDEYSCFHRLLSLFLAILVCLDPLLRLRSPSIVFWRDTSCAIHLPPSINVNDAGTCLRTWDSPLPSGCAGGAKTVTLAWPTAVPRLFFSVSVNSPWYLREEGWTTSSITESVIVQLMTSPSWTRISSPMLQVASGFSTPWTSVGNILSSVWLASDDF